MNSPAHDFDVIIIGAGASGMMCALEAAKRGRRVALLDHGHQLGAKILISGGGRCNFTNLGASSKNYVSQNPHFCKSALSRYGSAEILELVKESGLPYEERKWGQLFFKCSAREFVEFLRVKCEEAGVLIFLQTSITGVTHEGRFEVRTSKGVFAGEALVVATGGLSIPKVGASGFGYELARQFGHTLVKTAPALDGFVFSEGDVSRFGGFAGLSLEVQISCGGVSFTEALLFTHTGLSGPVSLQASLHWSKGETIEINLLPGMDLLDWLKREKAKGATKSPRGILKNLLCEFLPSRLAERLCELHNVPKIPLPELSEKAAQPLFENIHHWRLTPASTVGYNKAEVTRGGINTDELSSKTMESKKIPGLYFIGEVVDVTGWLGGYNFQWAWASGWAAGQVV